MPSRRTVFLAVALCDVAMMVLAIGINLVPTFLTTLAGDLGGAAELTKEQLGRIGAFTFAGLVAGILVAGPLADRLGGRAFAIAGNVLVAAGLIVLATAPTYEVILAGSFVMGLGAGALDMVLSPIVSALQPERRTVSMNLLHSFYCTGAVLTILTVAVALRAGLGWRPAAWGLVPLPLVIAVGFAFTPLPPLVEPGQVRVRARSLVRERFFLVTLVAIFLGGATELAMQYWLAAYAEQTLGYSRWVGGMALLGFSLAMAVGRLAIALLPHRVGPIALMLGCCAASAGLFVVASFAPWNAVALAACVLAGLTGSCLWPSTLAVAADRYPHGGATMFAMLAAAGNLGGILMPWATGLIADASNLRWGLVTAALCPALMIVALLWMRRHGARK